MDVRTTPGMKAALTIAGSDSSGGAGVQADLKTWAAMDVFGCSAITAITAQNTRGVKRVEPLAVDLVIDQIDAIASDIDCQATKTGMIPSADMAREIAKAIKRSSLQPLVVDPVMVAKSGDRLVEDEIVAAITKHLFPLAAIVTPNRFEAARLLGGAACETISEGVAAAKEIAKRFRAHAVVVTGFPRPSADGYGEMIDVFWNGEAIVELTGERRQSSNTHGAGCTFSAAIAGGLARGKTLVDAVEQAKRLVTEAIRQNINIGSGTGPVNHLAWIDVKK